MSNIKMVFRFGWLYLRRYWTRLLAGVLFGIAFGLSNASFVWATKTLMERFEPPTVRDKVDTARKKIGFFDSQAATLQRKAKELIDPWLPRAGVELDWRMVLGGLLFLAVLVSIRSGTDYGSSYCMGWVSERVVNDLRLDVMQKLSTLSLGFFTRSSTGDLLTRINADTAKLQRALKQGCADLVKESIGMAALLVALLWVNWRLTALTFIFMPLCLGPLLVLGRKARRAARATRTVETLQTSQLVELLGSIRVVKAYNLEASQMERYRKLSHELVRHGMKGVQAKELLNPILEVISMFGLGVLVVFIFRTQTTVGDFVGFLTAVMLLFLSIKKLAGVHIFFEQANPSVTRLEEILREEPTVREPLTPKPIQAFKREIRFDHVAFAYEKDRPVLEKFSLAIPRGAKVGIAGPSGSGKSTLVNLMLRFYDPVSGKISIDGIDLREMSFRDLRQLLALVSQEIVLFDTTVAENIAQGKAEATTAEIETASRDAYAHEFITQLPQGYNTPVGERGVTLSGGQRQRIAIARAFIRNAPILVLDEATASLDSQAEAEVQRAIDHLSENRTVISVAHRLSTLSNCDTIVVLSQGRIIEQGGFVELLKANGAFAAMARRQGISNH
ncbi:MAG: ABC transporter ATP-binding protein/permease [Verrucomicrobia subdivision 3 bacterium]|nr:ABC transporter ATP-binding protein/permease [Limisphaerales bacterium]